MKGPWFSWGLHTLSCTSWLPTIPPPSAPLPGCPSFNPRPRATHFCIHTNREIKARVGCASPSDYFFFLFFKHLHTQRSACSPAVLLGKQHWVGVGL